MESMAHAMLQLVYQDRVCVCLEWALQRWGRECLPAQAVDRAFVDAALCVC